MIPDEDLAAVEERIEAFEADLKPRNGVVRFLANRAAVLSVRMDRCVRQEAAKITRDMIRAEADEAEDRADELEFLVALIHKEPAEAIRNFVRSPEGIDWLIQSWRGIRADLFDPKDPRFILGKAQRLLGHKFDVTPDPRLGALSLAMAGYFKELKAQGWPDLSDAESREAVQAELKRFVENQLARLEDLRATLDHEAIARDRAGARARAIFDPSKEAILARKYEAAAERAFHKTLKEIERINSQAEESEGDDATHEGVENCDELASSLIDDGKEAPTPFARRSLGPQLVPSLPKDRIPSPETAVEKVGTGEICRT